MKKLFTLLLSVLFVLSIAAACDNTQPTDPDTTAPVITLSGEVPSTGILGREVSLPTATATDDVDGNLTSSVKVTVKQYKADNVTLNRELVYEQPANTVQKFTPGGNMTKYEIIYFVRDAAGNRAEKKFNFTATEDNLAPELTINTDSVTPELDLEQGMTGRAAQDIILPSANGLDQPGDFDISDAIRIRIFVRNGTQKGAQFGSTYTGAANTTIVRCPEGEYIVEYSLQDGAGNAADSISFYLTVEQADTSVNLLLDRKNFAYDSREGMANFNEFGELVIGHRTISDPNMDQPLGASLNVIKIYEQIVAVKFNADPAPSKGGQWFYDISARGSKNRDGMPDSETGCWPPYLFLRINAAGLVDPRVSSNPEINFTTDKAYSGANFIDGKDHTLYVQWLNEGTSASDANAKIILRGWVDVLPTAAPSFQFSVKSAQNSSNGFLQNDIFETLYNETGAGWLSFASVTNGKTDENVFDNDHMRIKGIAIYDKNATTFNVDIDSPVLTIDGSIPQANAVNEAITLPVVTADDNGTDVTSEITIELKINDQDPVTITGTTYTPTITGAYKLIYSVYDEAGNIAYKVFSFTVSVRDTTAPVITVDQTAINAVVGESFIIPVATANDDIDGNISANIKVDYVGAQFEANITRNGMTSFVPMAIGEHKLIYKVTDTFGNTSEKEVIVNVSGEKTGNVLTEPISVISGGQGYTDQYIYNKKVSMILNVESDGLLMFNIRGLYDNPDWPNGMVLRTSNGKIEISARGHDSILFGDTPSPYSTAWKRNVDTLFEFMVSDVTVDGIDYIKVQIWFQGEELEWTAKGSGETGVEAGSKAIYRKKSLFSGNDKNNIYAGQFWVVSYAPLGGKMTIKELRIDGTSCNKPADPTPPVGLDMPSFNSAAPTFSTPTVSQGTNAVIANYANQEKIYIKFKAAEQNSVDFLINLVGTNPSGYDWHGGLLLHISSDGVYLDKDVRDNKLARMSNWTPYQSPNVSEHVLVFKLTYVENSGLMTKLQIDIWVGTSLSNITKAEWAELAEGLSVVDTSLMINPNVLSDSIIAPAPVRLQIPISSGKSDIIVVAADIFAEAPQGLEMPEFSTEEATFTTGSVAQGTNSVIGSYANEDKILIKFKTDTAATTDFLFNLVGTNPSGFDWHGGLLLHIGNDGVYLEKNVRDSKVARVSNWAPYSTNNTDSYIIVFQLTYIQSQDIMTALQFDLWFGTEEANLTKAVWADAISGVTIEDSLIISASILDSNIIAPAPIRLQIPAGSTGVTVLEAKKVID